MGCISSYMALPSNTTNNNVIRRQRQPTKNQATSSTSTLATISSMEKMKPRFPLTKESQKSLNRRTQPENVPKRSNGKLPIRNESLQSFIQRTKSTTNKKSQHWTAVQTETFELETNQRSSTSTSSSTTTTATTNQSKNDSIITIDQLIGSRIDSGRLKRILEHKVRSSANSSKQLDRMLEMEQRLIMEQHNLNSNDKNNQVPSPPPLPPQPPKEMITKQREESMKQTNSFDTSSSWIFEIDSDYRLVRKQLDQKSSTNEASGIVETISNNHQQHQQQQPQQQHNKSLSELSATTYPLTINDPIESNCPSSMYHWSRLNSSQNPNFKIHRSSTSTFSSSTPSTSYTNNNNNNNYRRQRYESNYSMDQQPQNSMNNRFGKTTSILRASSEEDQQRSQWQLEQQRRRQSDHHELINRTQHRPSLADRRRFIRSTIHTAPNELLSTGTIEQPQTKIKIQEDNNSNADILQIEHQLPLPPPPPPPLPPPPQNVDINHLTIPNNSSAISLHPPTPPTNNGNTIKPTNATNQSSPRSNRFESLLRHQSFLKTAASRTISSINMIGRRRSSELESGIQMANAQGTSKIIQVINDHSDGVNCLELSEDRSLLVSGGEDGIVRLWSTFSTPCECIGILIGHQSYITCCTVHKLIVISGSADQTIKLWSIEDGNCLMTLTGHTTFINRVICYGTLLLSSSFDGNVRIWSLSDQLTMIENMKSMGNDGGVKVDKNDEDLRRNRSLDIKFGQCLHTLSGHSKSVSQVAIVAAEPMLLNSGIIQELDIVISTSADSTARTWSLANGELRHILSGHVGPINCLAIDPKESRFIYTAGADWIIRCWDVVTGELVRDLKGHQNSVLCLLSHNHILYSGSADNTVRAWAMEFGQCTRIFYRATNAITCIQYFGGIVYTGSNDHSARMYDSNSAVLKQTFTGHQNAISSIKVVPGKLFTSSYDGKIIVWDCSTFQTDDMNDTSTLNRSIALSLRSKMGKQPQQRNMYIGQPLIDSTLDLITMSNTRNDQQNQSKNNNGKLRSIYLQHQMEPKQIETDRKVNCIINREFAKERAKIEFNRMNGSTNQSTLQKSNNRQRSSILSDNNSINQSGKRNRSLSNCFGANRIWPERFTFSSSSSSSSPSSMSPNRSMKIFGRFLSSNNNSKNNKNRSKSNNDDVDDAKNNPINRKRQIALSAIGPNDDSANVRRAIDALEPYLRSFK